MLRRESGVTGQIDRDTIQQALKTRARRKISPAEAAVLLGNSTADGVINADFRELNGKFSLRLSLVSPAETHFYKTVTLESRPQTGTGKPQEDSGKSSSGSVSPASGSTNEPTGAGTSGQSFSGYVVSRPAGNGIRKTARTRGRTGSAGAPVNGIGPADATDRKSSRNGTGGNRDGKRERSGSQTGPDTSKSSTRTDSSKKSDNGPPPAGVPNSPVARGVLRFASSQIGKQVGNGQCWTLAAEALKAAGARPPQGYTYGEEIPLRNIQPGDILQFTRARFDEPGYWAVMGTPNHTAVVYSLGNRTFILHQNFAGRKFVQTFDLDFDNLTSGKVQAFRPRPAVR